MCSQRTEGARQDKGTDEAGTVGALPAIVNAVDALAPVSVKYFDMPATSARIWQAMTDVYRDA